MEVDNEQLSRAINSIRKFLLNQNFFEVHLYSTTNYKIENTNFFQLKDDLFLRFNPEPDIWQAGLNHNKFFWIGSMFRNEPKLSIFHSFEFSVADIYEMGDKGTVKKKLIAIIKQLEKDLRLKPLSKKVIVIDYNDSMESVSERECWILVDNYPKEESFYDTSIGDGRTKKFEFFYKNNDEIIEIVACGELGENANPKNFIKNKDAIVQKEPLKKGFVGFGIGIERLMALYSMRQK
ncbi:MAG: hypothetical protein AABX47_09060 [Nanoarchaeota archaeon]